jgi:hypothetical protein
MYQVFVTIKEGSLPKTLWVSKRLKVHQVLYALTVLRREGIIKRVGKAWVILKDELPEELHRKRTHRVDMKHTPPNDVMKIRGHGFQFTLRLPELKGWTERESVLKKKGIPYVSLPGQHSQRINVGDMKVWLTPRSIVFYLGKISFFSDIPQDAGQEALDFVLKAIRKLENDLGIGSERLKMGKGYWIKVSRSHYAIIHDGLAKRMDNPRRKVYVYDEKGLWFLIDNSFNLHEAEFVRSETNVDEATFYKNVYLNDLNKTRLLPSTTLAMIKRVEEKTGIPGEIMQKIETVEKSMLGFMPGQMALSNSMNMQATALLEQTKILNIISEKVLTREALKDNTAIKVEITEDTGDFMGLTPFTYEEHEYNLTKGSVITLERDTANALIMNRKARIV